MSSQTIELRFPARAEFSVLNAVRAGSGIHPSHSVGTAGHLAEVKRSGREAKQYRLCSDKVKGAPHSSWRVITVAGSTGEPTQFAGMQSGQLC
jgi:hypothetical protein